MLKKSRIIAVLLACVMMFGVVQPTFAKNSRTWEEVGEEATDWGMWGAVIGGTIAVIATGGAALPLVIGAGAAGAVAGAGIGATAGALGSEGREKVAVTAAVLSMILTGASAPTHAPAK